MTPEVNIEFATVADIDELLDWRIEVLSDVFAPLSKVEIPDLREANRRYYTEALSDGSHEACFAVLDGAKVGCGGVCLQREMPSPDNASGVCGYLMNIYVRPRYRGRGLARRIVESLVRVAVDRGAGKVWLESTDAAHRLYESEGFRDINNIMKIELKT